MVEEIEISAPAPQVWTVFSEVERWPEWTPSVTRAAFPAGGPLATGAQVRIKQPGMLAMVWTVTDLTAGRSWRWAASSPGVTTAATHVVEAIDDETCIVRQTIEHEGALSGLIGRLTRTRTRRLLAQEAAGLKQECETAWRARAESP